MNKPALHLMLALAAAAAGPAAPTPPRKPPQTHQQIKTDTHRE